MLIEVGLRKLLKLFKIFFEDPYIAVPAVPTTDFYDDNSRKSFYKLSIAKVTVGLV